MHGAAILHALTKEVDDTIVHRDAVLADTRKWDSLVRTIQDVVELSAKLKRDQGMLLEELAVKRRAVQLARNEKDAVSAELFAIEQSIGETGKFVR